MSNTPKFKADILIGTYGTVVAYALSILLLPLISRYYQPEHIGVWQVLLATIGIIMPLATFQFERAIILEKNKRLISHLITVIIINTLIICSFLLFVILSFGEKLNNLFKIHIAINIGWILIIAIIVQAHFLVFTALIVKEKHFKTQAIAKILGALTVPAFALLSLLFFNASSILYIEAAILAIFVQAFILYQQIDVKYLPTIKTWHKEKLLVSIKKYNVYPIYMVPYALSHGAVWQITLMSITILFSASTVGAYAVARQLVYIPVSLLTVSLRQVIFSHASSVKKYDPDISKRIHSLLTNIVNIAIPFAVFGFFYLPNIINFTLGVGWEQVGIFSPWLLISAVALMLSSWLDRIFDVYGKQRFAVILQLTSDALFLFVLLACYLLKTNAITTIIYLSVYVAIYNILWLYVVLSILEFKANVWLLLMIRVFVITLISFAIIKILGIILPFKLAVLIELLLLLSIIYHAYIKIRNFND